MLSASWIIYFAGVVDKVLVASTICLVASVIGTGISFIIRCHSYSEKEVASAEKALKAFIIALGCTMVVTCLTPTQNTIYLIAGAKVTEDIVKTPQAKEIGGKILAIINEKLDSQIKEKK